MAGFNSIDSVLYSPLYEVLAHQNYLRAKADHEMVYSDIKRSQKR